MVARDLILAEDTAGRYHVAHLSTARSLDMVRRAKAQGLGVTCEVAPHHLILTDEEVAKSGFSTQTKMKPPLRSAEGPRRAAQRPRRRRGRLHRERPRAAPRRREGRAVQHGPLRHRGAGDHAQPLPRPPGAAGDLEPAAARPSPLDRPGAGARGRGGDAEGGERRGRHRLPSRRARSPSAPRRSAARGRTHLSTAGPCTGTRSPRSSTAGGRSPDRPGQEDPDEFKSFLAGRVAAGFACLFSNCRPEARRAAAPRDRPPGGARRRGGGGEGVRQAARRRRGCARRSSPSSPTTPWSSIPTR